MTALQARREPSRPRSGSPTKPASGWPDVVFSTQNNDAALGVKRDQRRPSLRHVSQQGFPRQGLPRRLHARRAGPRDDRRHGLWTCETTSPRCSFGTTRHCSTSSAMRRRKPGRTTRLSATSSRRSIPDISWARSATASKRPYIYYWSGQAPVFQVKGDTFSSDVNDPNTKKVTALLDHMLKNGTITQDSVFGAPFVAKADHLVAIPGPAWYSGALFQNPAGVNAKPGTWAAAAAARLVEGRQGHRQCRRRRLVRLEPHDQPGCGQNFPGICHHQRQDGRDRRPARLQGGRGQVA